MGAAELANLGVKPASALAAPQTGLTADRAIPVQEAIRDVLPQRALVRGTVVSVAAGIGATSLAFALIAEATQQNQWAAFVGLPGLGWATAIDQGVDLGRVATVPFPGTQFLPVVATLLDGFAVVVAGTTQKVSEAMATQLAARARNSGSVLITLGQWPAATVTLSTSDSRWLSRGRLRCRSLTVKTSGRAGASRTRETHVWLPDDPAFRQTHPGQETPTGRHLRTVS